MIAFAMCLLIGALEAENPFTTTVSRALVAMFGTFVVGLILGAMGRRMLTENVQTAEKLKESQEKTPANSR